MTNGYKYQNYFWKYPGKETTKEKQKKINLDMKFRNDLYF